MEKWHDFGPSRVTWYKSFQITWEWRTYGTHCDRILCSYWANIIQHDKTQQQRMTHIWLIVIVEMIILFSKPKGQSSLFMPPVIHLCHFHGMMWPFQGYYNAFDILSPSVPSSMPFPAPAHCCLSWRCYLMLAYAAVDRQYRFSCSLNPAGIEAGGWTETNHWRATYLKQ